MNNFELKRALKAAEDASRAAGKLMHANLRQTKRVNAETSHDIKLELDVRCQKLIERMLARAFPEVSLLGEEGDAGFGDSIARWVVDPIDGTVNFAYGIPHACVSIALQIQTGQGRGKAREYQTVVGVVFDPFTEEMWTAIRGGPARLNGVPIRVSERKKLNEAIVSIGFSKSRFAMEQTLPYFNWLSRRVRKMRMFGAAALSLTYVATGRLDAYIERGINLWDVAAGGLILECAGGVFRLEVIPRRRNRFRMVASNRGMAKHIPMLK
jgi:myo-inositol-1(or 4)-monophosphatase